jgi:hypothetical protein
MHPAISYPHYSAATSTVISQPRPSVLKMAGVNTSTLNRISVCPWPRANPCPPPCSAREPHKPDCPSKV